MISLLTLALLSAVPILIYLFFIWNYDHWRKRGVAGPQPSFFVGSFPSLLSQKQTLAEDFNDVYKQYKSQHNFVGTFIMRVPQLMILEPSMSHEIYGSAFKHFANNEISRMFNPKKEPLFANNPFVINDQQWKAQRTLLSPGMTGSRIKTAYSAMQEVCKGFCDYIERESKLAPKDGLNGKHLALLFTSENVLESVLGIKAKSFTKQRIPVSENISKFTENNMGFLIITILAGIFPNIVDYYRPKLFPADSEKFFLNLMKEAFRIRSASKVNRQDFMSHLMSIKEKLNLNDTELSSHSMTFLLDGLETTAVAISHCLLLLARDVSVQEKLRQEILANLDEHGELNFEKLTELPYLDACIHESLRFFTPILSNTKMCTQPYELTDKNGQKLLCKVGDVINIPFYSFHFDPAYYSEPEKFQPERFMPENGGLKKYFDQGVYLGFGSGPRMCLGMRFALVQSKAAIYSLVKNFHIKTNPKTIKENKLDPKSFFGQQEGGVWLNFEKII